MRILLLLFTLATIALPSGYGIATITNPTSALNKFVFSIDLSLMPAEWWAQVTDTSGMKMLAYKSTGTRLPIDLVFIDTSAHTGCVKGMWTGTLASSGTQQVIVFPPDSGRSVTLPADPYGKNAVYSNYIAYFPLDGNGNERSGNGYDLTVSGAFDTLGHNCRALRFDGIDDYAEETTNKIPANAFYGGFSVSCWIYPVSGGESAGSIIDKSSGGNGASGFGLAMRASVPGSMATWINANLALSGTEASFSSYHYVTVSYTVSGAVTYYIDGALSSIANKPTTALTNITTTEPLTIGNRSGATDRTFDGIIDDVQIVKGTKSAGWNTQEFLMESDQATFWGTWTWVTTNNYPKRSNWSTFNDRWRGWRW